LGRAVVSSGGGIQVEYGSKKYLLDPRRPSHADCTFVSHAHVDHMHRPSKSELVLSSRETRELAAARGYDLGETVESIDGIELLDSGHILGSRALRIEDEIFYTGDASGRSRAFLKRCETKRTRVLIMETTYGSPGYTFPSTAKLVREVNGLIGEMYHRGKPVILMGYPLGKAQLLSYFFSSWDPFFVHESVARINAVHIRHGVRLKEGRRFDPEEDLRSLPQGPWLMIAPLSHGRSRVLAHLKKAYGAVLVAFSGWATDPGYAHSMATDYAFPLSDHCDYDELIRLVREVSPEEVYTTHGFAAEFARDLRKIGFAARPLTTYQSSLSEYLNV
jgi:putative mRNA 3-end processing factor